MRVQQFHKALAAAAVVLAAGLPLTACDGGRHNAASSAAAPSPGATAGSGGGSAGRGPAAATTAGPATGATASAPGSATASAGRDTTARPAVPCRTAHLTFATGAAYGKGPYSNIPVRLTNSGSATCSLRGFPGVDLVGSNAHRRARPSLQAPHTVLLVPGRSTSFLLILPQNTGSGSKTTFTRAVVTLPHESLPRVLRLRVSLPARDEGPGRSVLVGPLTR